MTGEHAGTPDERAGTTDEHAGLTDEGAGMTGEHGGMTDEGAGMVDERSGARGSCTLAFGSWLLRLVWFHEAFHKRFAWKTLHPMSPLRRLVRLRDDAVSGIFKHSARGGCLNDSQPT
jgi:hypothetical protein